MIRYKVKVNLFMLMAIIIKGIGSKIKLMDMVCISI